jgi:cytochrome c
MKTRNSIALMGMAVLMAAGIAGAAQEASVEAGKALFNDPKLGTSGKTCTTCHVDGKGLDKAAANKELENTINACITKPLKGKALDAKSTEMKSLVMYIKSLSAKK